MYSDVHYVKKPPTRSNRTKSIPNVGREWYVRLIKCHASVITLSHVSCSIMNAQSYEILSTRIRNRSYPCPYSVKFNIVDLKTTPLPAQSQIHRRCLLRHQSRSRRLQEVCHPGAGCGLQSFRRLQGTLRKWVAPVGPCLRACGRAS